MNKADRIYKELLHERAGIWYISDIYGSKIMIKIPSTSIKALVKGCKIELLFGKDDNLNPNVFHTGVRIYDDPINYQIISSTQRFLDEHLSLAKIMHLTVIQIQLYNELNICQAYGDFIINNTDRHDILAFLGNPKQLFKGEFDIEISKSLDNFQYSLDFNISYPNPPKKIKTLIIEGQTQDWNFIQNHIINEGATADISIVDNDEGSMLEQEIFIVLSSLFGTKIFRGPKIPYKKVTRELTDILAFSKYGIFFIEAKALGVINTIEERNMDRKVAGLQKQIEKAINQLVGAAKRIVENTPVFDEFGKEIFFDKTLLPHGIVLVSELFPFGNWERTIFLLLQAMSRNKIWIHVMDMKEFMQFVGYARGDKNRFDYFLMERIKNFVKNPSIIQQTQFIDANTINPNQ